MDMGHGPAPLAGIVDVHERSIHAAASACPDEGCARSQTSTAMTKSSNKTDIELVRLALSELELDQEELGRRLGVHRRTVNRWVTGVVKLKKRDRIAIQGLLNVAYGRRIEG
jgi:DNA-binding transcriptional regulator YiaG